MHSPDELGAGAARARPIPILLSPILSLSLLGNHEEYSRTGLSGRGAAVGIGNQSHSTNYLFEADSSQCSFYL